MKYLLDICFLITALLLAFIKLSFAHTFSPSLTYLTASGNSSSFLFTVTNPENRIIPLDITIYDVSKDLDGKPIEGSEIIDDFLIYPAQLLLQPGETTSVLVRWIGDPDILQERTFTLFSRELPLPLAVDTEAVIPDGIFAKITVLRNYGVRVYVAPAAATSDIVIKSVDNVNKANGERKLVVTVFNQGKKHGKLMNAQLVVRSIMPDGLADTAKQTVILTRTDIPGLATAIFANSLRRFVMPWPEQIPFGPVSVTLKNDQN